MVGKDSAVAVVITIWYIVFICHQDNTCENYIASVYVGGYYGLIESGLCVFGKLCPVGFLVVCKSFVVVCSHVVCLLTVVMIGRWSDDSTC